MKSPLTDLEDYVWQRFGNWHLPQPHVGDPNGTVTSKCQLRSRETSPRPRDSTYSRRLTSGVISELIRDCGFLEEQKGSSAEAANKGTLGPLAGK